METVDYSLYLITDRGLLGDRDLITEVRRAVRGGVTMVQLREKDILSREFYHIAVSLKEELARHKIPLIINDRLDIALAVDADGLHIGQDDLPLWEAQRLLGNNKMIGLSVNTLEQALDAESSGASYLGVGPVFFTQTKIDIDKPIGIESLKYLKQNLKIPLVAIGGINKSNIAEIKKTGVDGVAVASALMGVEDIAEAARRMMSEWKGN
jgi:thiamine-phosphate pyrophosphorylase